MLKTILALCLITGAFTFAATPQAMATCYSNSSCGGKTISSKKTCSACLRGKDGGKSWSDAGGACLKTCPKQSSKN